MHETQFNDAIDAELHTVVYGLSCGEASGAEPLSLTKLCEKSSGGNMVISIEIYLNSPNTSWRRAAVNKYWDETPMPDAHKMPQMTPPVKVSEDFQLFDSSPNGGRPKTSGGKSAKFPPLERLGRHRTQSSSRVLTG